MDAAERRRDWLAIALLWGLATLLFADVLFFGQQFYLRDLTRYYYPTKNIVREIILGGHFPWWNPYYGAGQPMAANPEYEVFYPLQWLTLLPDYNLGYRLHIIIHVHLTLAGMYLFLRSMRRSREASFLGAMAWGMGGLFLSFINLLPILFCAAWIPWLLMSVRRVLLRFNLRDFALASLLGGMQLLAAEPTTLLQTWFLIGMYGVYRISRAEQDRVRAALRVSGLLPLMLLGTLCVGAVQLVPALDHVGDSARSRPFAFDLVSSWSMPFVKPLELLFPNLLGHISVDRIMWYWAGGLYPKVGSPFIFNYYLGLLTITCAVAGLSQRFRGRWLLVTIGIVSVLLAFGGNTPLLQWLYQIGVARSIRYPEKFALMGLFALLVFAAAAADRLFSGDRRTWRAAFNFAAIVTGTALVIAIVTLLPWYPQWFKQVWSSSSPNLAFLVRLTRIDWWLCVARGTAMLTLLIIIRNRTPPRWWYALAAMFLIADLAPIGTQVNPRMPRRFFTPPEIAATLAPDRASYRIFHEADWYGTSDVARHYFGTGASVYWMVRNGLHPMTTASWGFSIVMGRDYDRTELLPTIDLTDAMFKVRDSRLEGWRDIFMNMSNARYVSEYVPFKEEKARVGKNLNAARPIRFIEKETGPRYRFADRLVKIRSSGDFINRLRDGDWTAGTAYVKFEAFVPDAGTILKVKEQPSDIVLDVECTGRCFLVSSITPHKYWTVRIDGRLHPAVVANVGYQGVIVPKGKHRVELRYRNPVIVKSGIVSVTAIVSMLFLVFVTRKDDRLPISEDAPNEGQAGAALTPVLPSEQPEELIESST